MRAGISAERPEDMSNTGKMILTAQEDGDMCLLVIDEHGQSAGVEFCSSGCRSPHTLQALRELSHAMKRDADGIPWSPEITW